jgi:hypothetical protein
MGSDEAEYESEGLGGSKFEDENIVWLHYFRRNPKVRMNFYDFFVSRRSLTSSMRHSSPLKLKKFTPVAAVWVV